MKSYSPYDNIEAKDYPAILVKTSFNDSQVMYWEPAKYVAKLRATKTDKNPLLFKINMAGGHGGSLGALRPAARKSPSTTPSCCRCWGSTPKGLAKGFPLPPRGRGVG